VTINKISIKLEKETLLFCVLVVWLSLKIPSFILGEKQLQQSSLCFDYLPDDVIAK
jgi:hypothetical protein